MEEHTPIRQNLKVSLKKFRQILESLNIEILEILELENQERGKRQDHHGITGPVHTFVKTDKHANFKWGVRHHVGHHYAGR